MLTFLTDDLKLWFHLIFLCFCLWNFRLSVFPLISCFIVLLLLMSVWSTNSSKDNFEGPCFHQFNLKLSSAIEHEEADAADGQKLSNFRFHLNFRTFPTNRLLCLTWCTNFKSSLFQNVMKIHPSSHLLPQHFLGCSYWHYLFLGLI